MWWETTKSEFEAWLSSEGWRLVEGYPDMCGPYRRCLVERVDDGRQLLWMCDGLSESKMYREMRKDLGKRVKEDFQ